MEEFIDVINQLIQANNLLNKKIEGIDHSIRELRNYFLNMGDFTQAMSNILNDALDKTSIVSEIASKTIKESGDFYKKTYSSKYFNQNIFQEWFFDAIVDALSKFSSYDEEYIENWLNIKFMAYTQEHEKDIFSVLLYNEYVDYMEKLFLQCITDLRVNKFCIFVIRTLFISYVSIYFVRPVSDYPKFYEWLKDIEKYREVKV